MGTQKQTLSQKKKTQRNPFLGKNEKIQNISTIVTPLIFNSSFQFATNATFYLLYHRSINISNQLICKMSTEMKSTKIVAGEETVKSTASEFNAQPGYSKKDCGKVGESSQVKRQWSESSDEQFNNEGKKCTIM